jgi:membrane protease YdiL (CAAX protease family)
MQEFSLSDEIEDPSQSRDAAHPTAQPVLAAQPSMLHKVFLGPDGLRAGWSLLIFFALLAAVISAMSFVNHKLHPPTPRTSSNTIGARFTLINESIPFLALLLVTWIMSKIERRRNSVYGLGGRHRLAHFFAGLLWGLLCLSLLIFTLLKTGLLAIDTRLLFGDDILRYGAVWFVGFLLVAILEEYLTRGYLQYTLTRGLAPIYRWLFKTRHSEALGFWTSALLFSFIFGFGHHSNPGESPIGMLSAGLIGLVFCLSLWRTGSLWWAIGFHSAWDWAQSFVYGVADSGLMVQHRLLATHPLGKPIFSGGGTGPEGSLFILAVVAVVILIIFNTLPRTGGGYAANLPSRLHPDPVSIDLHQPNGVA